MNDKEKALREELADLEEKLQDPAVFGAKNYPKLAKRKAELDDIVALFDTKLKLSKDN